MDNQTITKILKFMLHGDRKTPPPYRLKFSERTAISWCIAKLLKEEGHDTLRVLPDVPTQRQDEDKS